MLISICGNITGANMLLTDVVIESEQSASELCSTLEPSNTSGNYRAKPTLVALHDDPDAGPDTLVD